LLSLAEGWDLLGIRQGALNINAGSGRDDTGAPTLQKYKPKNNLHELNTFTQLF